MQGGIGDLAEFDLENPAVLCLVHQNQKTQSDAKSDWAKTKISELGTMETATIAEQQHTARRQHCPS
jgi:hypothetical protein